MEAVRWHGPGDLRLEDVELALPLGPGMVEAEVRSCGICGSDIAEFRAPFAIRPGRDHPLTGQRPPLTLGHEFSAVLTAVGEGVTELAPGDRVSADTCWRCGECDACRRGEYNLCRLSGSIGLSSDGAFAPLVRFPAYCAVPLPDGVGFEAGSLLEPLAVGLHALDRGGARPGDRLVVIGYGPIGACTALVARASGIEPLVVELHPGRRARAEAEGFATHEPVGEPREVAKAVRGLTTAGAESGANVVVDCSGAGPALEAAMEMTTRGGRVVVAGIPKHPVPVDAGRMVLYERGLLAALGYHNDLPRVAAMIAGGRLTPDSMITRRVPLAEAPAEVARLAADPGDDVKVLVEVGVVAPAEAATVVVPMPHMGVSVEEGTVIEWLVAAGEEVEADQVLCAIATDKVDTEVVAPSAGTVVRIIAPEGADVPVGEPLAELATAAGGGGLTATAAGTDPGTDPADAAPRGEPEAGAAEAGGASRGASAGSVPAPAPRPGASGVAPGLAERVAAGRDEFGRFDPKRAAAALLSFVPAGSGPNGAGAVLASPIARRMASGHGIDLASVEGSGRAGRVRKRDVEQALSSHRGVAKAGTTAEKATPGGELGLPAGYAEVPHEVVETPRVRRVIAEHMARSRQTAAHMTTEVDVDLTALTAVRAELNAARRDAGEPKLSYLPFLARAACDALADHRELNATFLGQRTILWEQVNLGVAVDTEEGLLVPVVRGCERLGVAAIGAAIADLAARARTRKLTPDDLAGGTFTLSNPGSVGAVSAPAIINQPQVAVLGVPAIQRRPWVVDGEDGAETIAIRPILRLAVTFDHRALDGADATRFAVAVKARLEAWGAGTYAEPGARPGA